MVREQQTFGFLSFSAKPESVLFIPISTVRITHATATAELASLSLFWSKSSVPSIVLTAVIHSLQQRFLIGFASSCNPQTLAMSPVLPPVLPPVAASLPTPLNVSLSFLGENFTNLSVDAGIVTFGSFPHIVGFNGSETSLPRVHGVVGVQHLTIQHDLGFQHHPPALCDRNTTLPLLRQKYGADGESYFHAVCDGVRQIQASIL